MKNQSYWTGFGRKSVSGIIVFVPNKRLWARLSAISSFIIKHIHTKMNHLTSIGRSIFDNASYVGNYVNKGESVTKILDAIVGKDSNVTLLAVDRNVTTNVLPQIKKFQENR